MPRIRTLEDLDRESLDGKRVLVRVDYNVPLSGDGEVQDLTRIRATLPTIRALTEAGARTLLVSHLGRPDGEVDPSASLAPVAPVLSELSGLEVRFHPEPPGDSTFGRATEDLAPGEVALLENVRFHPGETRNDPGFARILGGLARFFVGEAFGAAHRAHASTVGAAQVIREAGGPVVAGFLMEREIRFLREVLEDPPRPFVAILGGAKISGKIDLIEAILPRVDRMLIGGAMANTFLRALGLETGDSLVEEDRIGMAAHLMEAAGDRLLLPVDCVVADRIEEDASVREVDRDDVGPGDRIGDIGPRTRELFASQIQGAGTLLWNGPMGVFEKGPFAKGTGHVARAIAGAADEGTVAVVGGGDSAAAAEAAGVADRMTHISTGGGASLDLLAGKELPGVAVLDTVEEGRSENDG
jgi:phosphoglycerate kinase